jgi:hypothetical protein
MLQHNNITNTKKGEFVPSQGMTLVVSGVAVSIRNPEENCPSIAGEIYHPNDWFGAYPVFTGYLNWRLQVLSDECICMHYHYDRFLEVFGMEKLTEILANEAGCFEASLLRTLHTSLTERVFDSDECRSILTVS